ncbi:acyltransferase [Salmonella enterica subsp. diarizonae]|uniref:acyltransferase family protein n=1 Tax=Salmonella enterica TaxID=28901 RepID=UPI000B547DD2|nr:acyltransferase [Salmonella enterica]ASG85795.1 acyltransferase [Salmonella enterica subsp. diarizonae serovar 65:c:z str. SA20044251]ASG85797.1 acyltransferase [Salmonella enterica subsp. diarizonae serovar 65:c:z str. SA20044251]EDT8784665.1 acyltransferase [Salmonella enterica subsp. diarizonae]
MDKIFSIQILRGIAALFVVCFHFRYAVNDIYAQKDIGNRLFEFGSFGVDLFFIISGFIMAMSARKNENLSEFFIKRFFRIYPLYFVVLTLYILLSFNEYSLPQIIKSYLLVPIDYKSEMPYYGYSIMAIAWTLTYEFWFYFIFGISKKLSYKNKFIISSVLLSAPVVIVNGINIDAFHANYVLNWGVFNNIQFITNPVVYNFILGILSFNICVFVSKHKELLRPALSLVLPLLLLYGVIGVVSIRGMGHGINQWGWYCFIIVTSIVISEMYFKDMYANSKMVYLGEISFSIYLIHPLLFILVNSYHPFIDVFNSLSGFTRLSCLVAFVVCISHIVYRLIEIPTHNLGKKLAKKYFSQNIKENKTVTVNIMRCFLPYR